MEFLRSKKNENDFIFGIRTVIEAIRSGKTIDKLMIKKGLTGDLIQELLPLIKEHRINAQPVPEEKLNRITRKNHQGVIAFISPVEFYRVDDVVTRLYDEGKTPLLLVLDQVTDVRNFGAIVRSAECAGVDAIIIPDRGAAQINADAIKTSAGAIMHVPICKTRNLYSTLGYLKDCGIEIIAATEKAKSYYNETDFTVPCALVMGSEDQGITPDLLKQCHQEVMIPIKGQIGSLNVSVAAGILMYEAEKQRRIQK
jgi:23S rRNA (guanosine2251-2'-O)-methyltransferase